MARQYTGIDGALFADGQRVGKITAWTMTAASDSIETTTLGDFARTHIYGIQTFEGSCSCLFHEDDLGKIDGAALMEDTLRTTATPYEPTHTIELRLVNGTKTRTLGFKCLLNNVAISAADGEAITAEIAFTVSGPLTTASFL